MGIFIPHITISTFLSSSHRPLPMGVYIPPHSNHSHYIGIPPTSNQVAYESLHTSGQEHPSLYRHFSPFNIRWVCIPPNRNTPQYISISHQVAHGSFESHSTGTSSATVYRSWSAFAAQRHFSSVHIRL